MLKVIGYKEVKFSPDEQTTINGYKVFCTLDDDTVTGVACESFFISMKKADSNNFVPEIGQEINIYYNRYGKIDKIDIA